MDLNQPLTYLPLFKPVHCFFFLWIFPKVAMTSLKSYVFKNPIRNQVINNNKCLRLSFRYYIIMSVI